MRRLLSISILLLLPASLWAYTFHVYSTDSIQDSIDAASAGDTVMVHPGTYYESITLKHRVTVLSTDGAGVTTIDGESATQTVYSPSNADSFSFGDTGAGFWIEGGSQYGVWFSGSDVVHAEELWVSSDPALAGILISGCGATTDFEHLKLKNISGSGTVGLFLDYSDVDLVDVQIRNINYAAVLVESNSPDFTDLKIDDCGIGLWTWDGHPSVSGASHFDSCTTGAAAGAIYWGASLTLDDVDITYCTTGVATSATYPRTTSVDITGCLFQNCTDAMILDECSGSIDDCDFWDITDDGITITDNAGTITIGGSGGSANTFEDIGGDGIHVSSGASANIDENVFDEVDETAILVDGGSSGTTIDDCDMDGTGGCFEGIHVSGGSSDAAIRTCEMYDYEGHTSPVPRGAACTNTTADFGTSGDYGYNEFHDNSCDLGYFTRAESPDSLYAVGNWWGENPPDGDSFCGRTEYIVYEPYLTSAPRALPAAEPKYALPEAPQIVRIHPSPSRGVVEITYGLPTLQTVTLDVVDVAGRLVETVVDASMSAGITTSVWDGSTLAGTQAPSGIYLCRLTAEGGNDIVRFVLVR